jgi:hypothetical protein
LALDNAGLFSDLERSEHERAQIAATLQRGLLPPAAFGGESVSLNVADRSEGIDLRIGPMPEASTAQLREGLNLPGFNASLEDLADDLRVEENQRGAYLLVHFAAVDS